MTFLITRLALQSSRRHVAVTRSWLTLQAFRVDNASINMNKLLHRGLSHDKNYQVSLPRIGTPATMLTRGRSADKSRCLSSMPHKKVSTAQQLADHLDMVNLVSSNSEYQTARMSSGDISKIERLISRYLIVIATEPVINPRNIVDIFELYAKTGRPLMHDMHAFRDEFQRLGPVSEKALSTMTYTDLQQLARSLSFLRNQDLKLVSRLIQALCHECSSRVNTAPFQEGIKYFEIVHHFFGIRQPFYAIFSEYFCLHVDEASEKELIKLMHFCTRKQKTADAVLVQKALNRLENSLDSVSFVTLGVVADSVAKSGVELNRDLPLIQKIAPTLVAHVTEDKKWTGLEMYAVHSIVNLFRLSRFMDENVTSAIEHLLLNCEDSCLDAETIPGFLAFLASRSYHEDVFTRLENLIVLLLKSDLSLTLKLADLARIVWAFSSTNHKCSDEFVSLVFSNFHSMCALDKLNHNFLKFIDALQSLTMMGHINHHLASLAFEPLKGRALGYKSK